MKKSSDNLVLILLVTALTIIVGLVNAALPATLPDWPEQVPVGSFLVLDIPDGWSMPGEVTAVGPDEQLLEVAWRKFGEPAALAVETKACILTIDLESSAKRGLRRLSWSILVGEEQPGPDPPIPDPPVPTPTKLFAVVVYEEHDRDTYTPEQLAAIDSKAVREYMEGKGFMFRSVDKDVVDGEGNPPASIASFLQRAQGRKVLPQKVMADGVELTVEFPHLPRIIVADQTGNVLVDELVVDEAGLFQFLKKHGGE